MTIIETDRLSLEETELSDAPFIMELLNSPGWLRFIGDRGIRTMDDAGAYIQKSFIDNYAKLGFGMYNVVLKETGDNIGMCGLIKRDWLEHVDIGYALLPAYYKRGYMVEAAKAVLKYAEDNLGLSPICAITDEDNESSKKLLEKIGLRFIAKIKYEGDGDLVSFYSTQT